jgi:hypothetical protein
VGGPVKKQYLERGSPPSSYAMAAALEGEPGGWARVAVGTLHRSLLLTPGIALAGVRGGELVRAAVLGSAGITFWLFLLYSMRRGKLVKPWTR